MARKAADARRVIETMFELGFRNKEGSGNTKGQTRRRGRPRKVDTGLKASVPAMIEDALERMEALKTAIERRLDLKNEGAKLSLTLPSKESGDTLLRNETTCDHGGYRAIKELGELQRERLQREQREKEAGERSHLRPAS